MVGEIRDLETADIAIKAAQTGHLVLSTLHTNDAHHADAPAEHGRGAVQHRLQRAADHRPAPGAPPVRELQAAGRLSARGPDPRGLRGKRSGRQLAPYKAVGCSACNNGYRAGSASTR
jgi:type IV pilus assembly protein PilB